MSNLKMLGAKQSAGSKLLNFDELSLSTSIGDRSWCCFVLRLARRLFQAAGLYSLYYGVRFPEGFSHSSHELLPVDRFLKEGLGARFQGLYLEGALPIRLPSAD